MVERNGRYYLFIGPDWDGLMRSKAENGHYDRHSYLGTRVLESADPLHFELSSQVGYLNSHASEVIVDETGEYWVSHCGWGQGGVYLAPLRWDDD